MFKKTIYTIFISCVLSAQAFGLKLNSDLQQIVKDDKLTVAFVSGSYTQDFDVELAQHIADALSIELNPVFANDYNQAIALVSAKKAELAISNLTRTPERGKYVLFSKPYNNSILTVIEPRSSALATDLSRATVIEKYNQPGIKLGVDQGSVFGDIVREYFPLAQVVEYQDENQILKDIDMKIINAAITDNVIGRGLLKNSPQLSLAMTATKVPQWTLDDAIAMNTDHIYLLLWINLVLETLEQDGTLKAMRSQYFNSKAVK